MHAVVPLTAISKYYPCKAGWVHICDKLSEMSCASRTTWEHKTPESNKSVVGYRISRKIEGQDRTNCIEDENAFGPQSHGVGLSSAGCLNSWRNSAPQGT